MIGSLDPHHMLTLRYAKNTSLMESRAVFACHELFGTNSDNPVTIDGGGISYEGTDSTIIEHAFGTGWRVRLRMNPRKNHTKPARGNHLSYRRGTADQFFGPSLTMHSGLTKMPAGEVVFSMMPTPSRKLSLACSRGPNR